MNNDASNPDKTAPEHMPSPPPVPVINAMSFADLSTCLRKGIADFKQAPLFGLFIASTGTVIGLEYLQNPTTQMPEVKIGYGRTELAVVPINGEICYTLQTS